MVKKKVKSKQELSDEEIENIFNATWRNWASRRSCEQTHIPKFVKEENNWKEESTLSGVI